MEEIKGSGLNGTVTFFSSMVHVNRTCIQAGLFMQTSLQPGFEILEKRSVLSEIQKREMQSEPSLIKSEAGTPDDFTTAPLK
ncbi:hypothetical protein [Gimesia sp.]|uniref:hypothetical protein n=1 Tax=Gimesia sp. TaxID=2024833 RepID=UPI003A92EF17